MSEHSSHKTNILKLAQDRQDLLQDRKEMKSLRQLFEEDRIKQKETIDDIQKRFEETQINGLKWNADFKKGLDTLGNLQDRQTQLEEDFTSLREESSFQTEKQEIQDMVQVITESHLDLKNTVRLTNSQISGIRVDVKSSSTEFEKRYEKLLTMIKNIAAKVDQIELEWKERRQPKIQPRVAPVRSKRSRTQNAPQRNAALRSTPKKKEESK